MKISYNWLKDFVDMRGATPHGVPTPEELAQRLDAAGIDVEGISYLYKKDGIVTEDDTIIDIRVSKELSDYNSMMWTANEMCGLYNLPIDDVQTYATTLPDDRWVRNMIEETDLYVNSTSIRCKMLVGRIINHVKAKKSPDFIRNAVAANGYLPRHSLIDVPIYTTRNIGQPIYAVDLDKLQGKTLLVEDSKSDGVVVSGGKEYSYAKGDLVVTNGEKVISICGVVQDDSVAVDENTTAMVVFTAIFDADVVRETMNRLNVTNLNSEVAALGSNHASEMKAIVNVTSLLYEYAEAAEIEAMDIFTKYDFTKSIMDTTVKQLNSYLSSDYTYADIVSHLVNGKISFFVKEQVYHEGKPVIVDVCYPSPYVQDHIHFGSKLGSYRNRRLPCDLAQAILCFMGCDRIGAAK